MAPIPHRSYRRPHRPRALPLIHALPLRLRGEPIGALNLFRHQLGPLPPADLALGHTLADVATIDILSERGMNGGEVLNEQLQTALDSRVIIEQAKGVLAERGNRDMDAAIDRLRGNSRDRNVKLSDVGRHNVEADLATAVLAPPPQPENPTTSTTVHHAHPTARTRGEAHSPPPQRSVSRDPRPRTIERGPGVC